MTITRTFSTTRSVRVGRPLTGPDAAPVEPEEAAIQPRQVRPLLTPDPTAPRAQLPTRETIRDRMLAARGLRGGDRRSGRGGAFCDPHFASVAELYDWEQDSSPVNNTNFGSAGAPTYSGYAIATVAPLYGLQSLITTGTGNSVNMGVWDMATNDWTIDIPMAFNGVVFPATSSSTQHDIVANYNATTSDRSFLWTFTGDGGSNHKFSLLRSANGVAVSQDDINLGQALVDDVTYVFSLERNGGNLHAYLDGVLKGTAAIGAGYDYFTTGLAWRIGQRHSAGSVIASGRVDEFRFTRGVARYGGASFTPAVPWPQVAC